LTGSIKRWEGGNGFGEIWFSRPPELAGEPGDSSLSPDPFTDRSFLMPDDEEVRRKRPVTNRWQLKSGETLIIQINGRVVVRFKRQKGEFFFPPLPSSIEHRFRISGCLRPLQAPR